MPEIPHSWLRQKGTREEFERGRLQRTAAVFNLPLEKVVQKFATRPFGVLTEEWRSFVGKMEPGDELWFFSSPDETFAKKLGHQGFAIVREGGIRDTLTTQRP